MNPDDLVELGRVLRPHGLKGALKVKLTGGGIPRIETDEPVFILLQGGPVPFFAEERPDMDRNSIVLKLEGIDSIEQAESFVGKELLIEGHRILHEEESGPDLWIGMQVVDVNLGILGKVTGVLAVPQQSVLEVEQGDKQILIPAVEEIIRHTDHDKKVITVETPPGLVDIYLHG